MAIDYGVRQGLLSKGYTNDDIGYDQNTGYVQVKGQNFMKPELNMNGTTYTSRQNFDNAYNQFQNSQRSQQQQQLTNQYIQQVTNPTTRTNPYVDQYTQMIGQIQNIINRPMQDPYSTPQYAAAQAQAQRSAQQGIRAAQEALGAAGFGRSTALGNAAQREQNNATEYLMTQVLPSIQNQLQAQRQAEISSLTGLLNPVYNLISREDTQQRNRQLDVRDVIDLLERQGQTAFSNDLARRQDSREEAGLKGYYMPEGAREAINNILGLKQQAEQSGVTADQMAQYRAAADAERNRLYQMDIDPSFVGFDADYATAAQNAANFRGIPTRQTQNDMFNQQMEIQKFEYQKLRDQISDEQYKQKFDEDVRRFGLEFAANEAYRSGQLALAQDDNDRQWAQLDYEMSNSGDKYRGLNANQVLDNVRNNYTDVVETDTGEAKVITKDPNRRYQMFLDVIDSGLPTDNETNQVLTMLGLSKKEIDTFKARARKEFGGNSGN
ncbi:hypothetical protein [Paenibacillus naphthalenovorans]|uniref:hypothetical protein n=1 Tax=Paenibacillus naphthalenovorans TaxID=162209 RepID=UPI0008860A44|nr:hypothetical protein [Paenibacillus naphthalenovorans]SDJ60460.1 hypothetical protein SAMN05421868_13411 [Paenibacillus naphthalenovorans]